MVKPSAFTGVPLALINLNNECIIKLLKGDLSSYSTEKLIEYYNQFVTWSYEIELQQLAGIDFPKEVTKVKSDYMDCRYYIYLELKKRGEEVRKNG